MIPIEKLCAVRTVFCHAYPDHPCADGVASALLIRAALIRLFDEERHEFEVRFVTHGEQFERLEARPGMLFCDIAPPQARAQEFVDAGAIVLDHHATARSVVERFEHHAFGDEEKNPGVSGAVLAFREVYEPIARAYAPKGEAIEAEIDRAREFASLAGIRDTNRREDYFYTAACDQAEALCFWPWAEWPAEPFGADYLIIDRMMDVGEVLRKKSEERARSSVAYGQLHIGGMKTLVMPSLDTTVAQAYTDAELLVGFAYRAGEGRPPQLVLSLRSRGNFDCGAFCKRFGGGGHTKAAGCSLPVLPDDPQPFVYVMSLVEAFVALR